MRNVLFIGLLAFVTSAAAEVNEAFVHTWSGRTSAGHVQFRLQPAGAGVIQGTWVSPTRECRFVGAMDITTRNDANGYQAQGFVNLRCVREFPTQDLVTITAKPGSLDITIVGRPGLRLTATGLTPEGRRGLRSGPAPQIASSAIPGHWQGSDHGITVALDLQGNGAFAATLAGAVSPTLSLDGCAVDGDFAPEEARQNEADSFVGLGIAQLTSCKQAGVDGPYAVLVAASPDALSLTILESNTKLLFEAQRLTRTAALLRSASAPPPPQIVNPAIPGHYESQSGTTHVALDLAADGALSGTIALLRPCRFEGFARPDEAVQNDANGFLAFGEATVTHCLSTRMEGLHVTRIKATSAGLSLSLMRLSNRYTLVVSEDMVRTGP